MKVEIEDLHTGTSICYCSKCGKVEPTTTIKLKGWEYGMLSICKSCLEKLK